MDEGASGGLADGRFGSERKVGAVPYTLDLETVKVEPLCSCYTMMAVGADLIDGVVRFDELCGSQPFNESPKTRGGLADKLIQCPISPRGGKHEQRIYQFGARVRPAREIIWQFWPFHFRYAQTETFRVFQLRMVRGSAQKLAHSFRLGQLQSGRLSEPGYLGGRVTARVLCDDV
ncbi:MAG: hypothetical protein GEU79_13450 [Acidimicrobiia bacterium]|nr:hypothetical protein [Acidimicrobiia bacterium]